MTRPIILRRAARAEYDEAGDWYEQQRPGLGVAFTAAMQNVFDRIAANPRMHAVVLRDIRKPWFRASRTACTTEIGRRRSRCCRCSTLRATR